MVTELFDKDSWQLIAVLDYFRDNARQDYIGAMKIVGIDNDPVLMLAWPLEVEEYRRVFLNRLMKQKK